MHDTRPEASRDPDDSYIVRWYSKNSAAIVRAPNAYTKESCRRTIIRTLRQNAKDLMEEAKQCLDAAEDMDDGPEI